jgi:O-methyltransferase involved in polyketide biosynthesis
MVVSLDCGFDPRYWRIDNQKCKHIELDLPEVIEVKREIVKDKLKYEMIGCSVLDTSWIDKVLFNGHKKVLLIAEVLFMFLPKLEVIDFFRIFTDKFYDSQITF